MSLTGRLHIPDHRKFPLTSTVYQFSDDLSAFSISAVCSSGNHDQNVCHYNSHTASDSSFVHYERYHELSLKTDHHFNTSV